MQWHFPQYLLNVFALFVFFLLLTTGISWSTSLLHSLGHLDPFWAVTDKKNFMRTWLCFKHKLTRQSLLLSFCSLKMFSDSNHLLNYDATSDHIRKTVMSQNMLQRYSHPLYFCISSQNKLQCLFVLVQFSVIEHNYVFQKWCSFQTI